MFMSVLVSGCASSETVYLAHPATGERVQCGPYRVVGNANASAVTAQNELRYCVEDFQQQGYQRVAQ